MHYFYLVLSFLCHQGIHYLYPVPYLRKRWIPSAKIIAKESSPWFTPPSKSCRNFECNPSQFGPATRSALRGMCPNGCINGECPCWIFCKYGECPVKRTGGKLRRFAWVLTVYTRSGVEKLKFPCINLQRNEEKWWVDGLMADGSCINRESV
jgi:hypothetical protein